MKLTNVHENITLLLLRQIIFKIQARRKLNGEEFRKFEVAKGQSRAMLWNKFATSCDLILSNNLQIGKATKPSSNHLRL